MDRTKKLMHILWAIVTQHNLILDIQIGSPVADFSGTLVFDDRQDGLVVFVMDRKDLLFRVLECYSHRRTDALERAIIDGRPDFEPVMASSFSGEYFKSPLGVEKRSTLGVGVLAKREFRK
jgi:hypothetical protein